MHLVAVDAGDNAELRVAKLSRSLADDVEHGLHVGRRTRDDAQDCTRCRLMLERFLRLVEQAHILDRDRGLIGEGLHQRDLPVREWPGLHPPERNHTDRTTMT